MSCKINKTNGKKSVLYTKILDALGSEDLAKSEMLKINGPKFQERFPFVENFKSGYKNDPSLALSKFTNDDGEPSLHKKNNQYYINLPDGTKYFLNKVKFGGEISPDQAEEISNQLLYEYVTADKNMNFNDFTIFNPKNILPSIEMSMEAYKVSVAGNEEAIKRADLILKYKHDFKSEIINKIEEKGFRYKEKNITPEGELDANDGDNITEEEKTEALNTKESFAKNSKDNATANVKLFLSTISNTGIEFTKEGPKRFHNLGTFLSKKSFVQFDEVWSTLEPILSDVIGVTVGAKVLDPFDLMIAKLDKIKLIKPWIFELKGRLSKLSENKKSEFVQAFSKAKLNFYVTEYDGVNYKIINATSTNSRSSKIKNEWSQNFREVYLKKGVLSETSVKDLNTVQAKLDASYKKFKDDTVENGEDNAIRLNGSEIIDTLRLLGVKMDLADLSIYIKLNGVKEAFSNIDKIYKDTGEFLKHTLKEGTEFSKGGEYISPLDDQSIFKTLATAVAISETDMSENTVLGNDGKTYWTFSSLGYLNNKVNTWKKNKEEILNLTKKVYNGNSQWLAYLTASERDEDGNLFRPNEKERLELSSKRIDDLELGVASSFKSKGKNDGSDNKSIEFPDALNDNIHKVLGKKIPGVNKSYFSTITPADKSRKIEISGFDLFDSGIDYIDGKGWYIHPDTIDLFIGYFEDEYNRMKEVANELETIEDKDKIVHYHTKAMNGLKSQLFPDFNHDSKSIPDDLSSMLYKDGLPLAREVKGLAPAQKAVLAGYIEENIKARLKESTAELVKAGLLSVKDKKLISNSLDKRLLSSYSGFTSPVHAVIGDHFVNGTISSVEYGKLFSGDPAYYKNTDDLIKRIPATYTDGLQLRLTKEDHLYFNTAIIEGVEVASRYKDLIKSSLKDKKLAKAYDRVNTTDAQAWITPNRWEFLMRRLGKWSDAHDVVFERMVSGKKLNSKQMKLAMQPLKGVYFEINDGRPVYLKYSQAVLIPNLVKGTPMQKLYDKMTKDTNGKELEAKDEVHEVITIDGVKVGAMGITKIHEGDTTDIADNFELNVVPLSNRGWKLQQDLPTKLMHDTLVGSQIQKNILAGLVLDGKYTFNGVEKSGEDILREIHDTVSQLSNKGKEALIEQFGIVDGVITNKDRVYDALIEEYKSKGGNDNIIAALEKEMDFDAIPQVRGKLQSIFMSIMNKELIKIQTNGGSFIQVSPFGLETIDNTSGIKIVSDNYDGKGLKPPHVVDGVVKPGQCLIPHSQLVSILEVYNNSAKKEDRILLRDLDSEGLKKILDPSALELVTYRIPNQGMSSNDAMEIVGILPEGMGDSIIAYDAVPGKTGSDFDIDKMYVMMHNLEFRDGKIQKLEYSDKDNSKEQLQNKLVDLYKSVLTSTETYDSMMTSIDADFFKDDILELFPKPEHGNLSMFNPVQQIKTKFEYMSGKFGVAQTANQLVDHVLNQTQNIRLNKYLGIGHEVGGQSKFDKEYDTEGKYKIADSISAFLNAYVDIAKDPYISRGNHNTITANTTFMLLRAGAPLEWVNRFIGQPILKELVETTKNSQGKTAERLVAEGEFGTVDAITKVRKKYGIVKGDVNLDKTEFSKTKLRDNIKIGEVSKMSPQDIAEQGRILDLFEEWLEISKDFSASIMSSKADTNGGGGSFMDRLINENKVAEVFNKDVIKGFGGKFTDTMLGTYHENSVNWVGGIVDKSELFLSASSGLKQTFNQISNRLGKGLLKNKDLARVLDNSFYSYAMSSSKLFARNNEIHDELFRKLPVKIKKLKQTSDNFLIKELEVIRSGGYDFLKINSKNKPKTYQNKIYQAWIELLKSSEPGMKTIGVELAKYSYSQSGFQNNLNQFFTNMPHEMLTAQRVDLDIKRLFGDVKNTTSSDKHFIDQLSRHEYENDMIVPMVSLNKNTIALEGLKHKAGGFLYNPESATNSISTGKNEDGQETYPQFVKYSHGENKDEIALFKLIGVVEQEYKGKMVAMPAYYRTHKLGLRANHGSIYEYEYREQSKKSVVNGNNLTGEQLKMKSEFIVSLEKKGFIPADALIDPTINNAVGNKDNVTIVTENLEKIMEDLKIKKDC